MVDARLIRTRARGLLGPAVFLAAGVALLAWPGAPPMCPMRVVLRIPCPSCGMTRAARLACTGHFADATHVHPLWAVMLPVLAVAFIVEVVGYARTGTWGAAAERPAFRYAFTAVFAALLIVWAARFMGAFGGPVPI